MNSEPFEWIEIDFPSCSRDYGTAPCTAVLGTTGVRKCYKTKPTCQSIDNFLAGTPTTLRCTPVGVPIPPGMQALAILESTAQQSATVNIAGSDNRYGRLGKRTSLDFTLIDRTHSDVGFDPYVAGRMDGTAQTDEGGYKPITRGMFLAKLKARNINYSEANVRLYRGLIVANVITDITTFYYKMAEMDGPTKGKLKCQASGILDLANEKKSLCPKPSLGKLLIDINDVATVFSVAVGLGAAYAVSGRLTIGSEIMSFTRIADAFTVVRAQKGTVAASHSTFDTVQQNYILDGVRMDVAAQDIALNYGNTPASYITFTEWQAEVTKWAPSRLLVTDVCTPTAAATLLGEFSDLGCTIFEDERAGKLRLKMNRPVDDGETVYVIADANVRSMGPQDDRDEDRVTQILFCSKRFDPTKQLTDEANYSRRDLTVNPDAIKIYGSVRTKKIYTRWLDQGDDATVSIVSFRLLKRFENAPRRTTVTLPARYKAISLMDVMQLSTVDAPDATGNAVAQSMQVVSRAEPVPNHEVRVEVQNFAFTSRYARIAPNGTPTYASASAYQKARYCATVPTATKIFSDGSGGVKLI